MSRIIERPLIPAPKPGIYQGVPMDQYLRWDAIGSSDLEHIHRSPAYAHFWKTHDEEVDDDRGARSWGTALHMLCLEPRRFDQAVGILPPEHDGRTKEGKALKAQLETEREVVIKHAAAEEVRRAAARVRAHRSAGALLASSGPTEVSVVVRDPVTGLLCKCRPDKLIPSKGVLLDWKSTRMPSQRAFTKQAFDLGYDRKISFYLWQLNLLRELGPAPEYSIGAIVSVQNDEPYETCVYAVRGETLEVAQVSWRKDLARWAECKESGAYPGFDEDVKILDLPDWAKRLRLEDAGVSEEGTIR